MAELRFRTDDAPEAAGVTLDAFLEQPGAIAVLLEPDEDARALIPHLARLTLVEVAFPTFRDGRGYSAARILREAGYAGELRAAGDVLADQIPFMRRCGFDAFAPDAPLNDATVARLLAIHPDVYQSAADTEQPVWKRRHG
ncbi:MAG: DUF934 domain-containing protein [Alphaproteobacteria bacterium]|nr:DUF934 domain-containing protein [Alphaproteobacteria bacterium]MDE2339870.1 DUF934 domain-containing protein [Alphaproteobacteria bacterium]